MKLVTILACFAIISGCSATTLRCGTDGESSYVEVISVPQDVANTTRNFADLCAFNYEEDDG